jgi:hypothetical protein
MRVCGMTMRMRVGVLSLMMPFGFVCVSVVNSFLRIVVDAKFPIRLASFQFLLVLTGLKPDTIYFIIVVIATTKSGHAVVADLVNR